MVKIDRINPSHNRAGAGGLNKGRKENFCCNQAKKEKEKFRLLFRFRKLPRSLNQRGQRSQRLGGLEEGVL